MIKLYGIGFSGGVAKVRYCLNYLNLNYDWVASSPFAGDTKTPQFQSLTPTGKIPAIEIDGFKLFESNSINRYLAVTNNSALYPKDDKKRAIIDAWTDYGSLHVAQAMGRIVANRVFAPMTGGKVDEESLRVGLDFLDKYFPIIEKQLSANPYLAGAELSLADINLIAVIDPLELGEVSIDKYPALTKWRARMKAEAFYQKCYKDYTEFAQAALTAMTAK